MESKASAEKTVSLLLAAPIDINTFSAVGEDVQKLRAFWNESADLAVKEGAKLNVTVDRAKQGIGEIAVTGTQTHIHALIVKLMSSERILKPKNHE